MVVLTRNYSYFFTAAGRICIIEEVKGESTEPLEMCPAAAARCLHIALFALFRSAVSLWVGCQIVQNKPSGGCPDRRSHE